MRTVAFDRFHREPPSMRVLKWIIGPLLAVHIVLATSLDVTPDHSSPGRSP